MYMYKVIINVTKSEVTSRKVRQVNLIKQTIREGNYAENYFTVLNFATYSLFSTV